jgi:hypothetical protein
VSSPMTSASSIRQHKMLRTPMSRPFRAVEPTLATGADANHPQTYLADVLVRIVSGKTRRHQLYKLLVWGCKAARERTARVAA